MKSAIFSFAVLATTLFVVTSATAAKSDKQSETKYEYVQVNRFDVQQGVDFPPDYQFTIVEDMVKQLSKIKTVRQVLREGETLPQGRPVLMIAGTITKFKKGSQAERYLVGFGAGATVIEAQLKFYDSATKELLLDHKVDGKVIMGIMGGKSEGANSGLAKQVAKVTKEKFF